jgi:predicted metal-dependent phosphoesterase TrpH
MKTDLHIHTSTGSDGAFTLEEVFKEASRRHIDFMSVTDHDAIAHQPQAVALTKEHGIEYITGVELNVTFEYSGKQVSLDFLGYGYRPDDPAFNEKLRVIRAHREARATMIIDNLNAEFSKENIPAFTGEDLHKMQEEVDGILSRPHIADYLIKKGIVGDRQEAFDKYLVKCDVPKYPLSLTEASSLVRNAGGLLFLAHPNDPNGTSLIKISTELDEQAAVIREYILEYIDGVECWHSRHDAATTAYYVEFAKKQGLMMSGGSDCHQKPVLMGTLDIPDYVADQFRDSSLTSSGL